MGKIFVAEDKMRVESAGTVSITRLDKKVVWLLMPTEKMYMEQDIRLQNIVPTPTRFLANLTEPCSAARR